MMVSKTVFYHIFRYPDIGPTYMHMSKVTTIFTMILIADVESCTCMNLPLNGHLYLAWFCTCYVPYNVPFKEYLYLAPRSLIIINPRGECFVPLT